MRGLRLWLACAVFPAALSAQTTVKFSVTATVSPFVRVAIDSLGRVTITTNVKGGQADVVASAVLVGGSSPDSQSTRLVGEVGRCRRGGALDRVRVRWRES